jgi:hypothetical protein
VIQLTKIIIPNPAIWFLILQSALLVLHYGNIVNIPWWVAWFPTAIIIVVLTIVAFLLAMFLTAAFVMLKILEAGRSFYQ